MFTKSPCLTRRLFSLRNLLFVPLLACAVGVCLKATHAPAAAAAMAFTVNRGITADRLFGFLASTEVKNPLRAFGVEPRTSAPAVFPNLLVANAELNQCANGPVGGSAVPCSDSAWVSTNVNDTVAHWVEGDSVPFRQVLTGFTVGTDHTVTIGYDTTKGGKHAFDYLTSFDRTETFAMGNNPCSGVPGCSLGTFSTAPIAIDPNVTAGFDQIPGNTDDITQIPGVFTLFGGTITGVSAYTTTGSYAGDSHTTVTISFHANQAGMVLAWGGHIATRQDWGSDNTTISTTGSPYHMDQESCSFSCASEDRAISHTAILPAPFVVNTTADTDNGVCEPVGTNNGCTLREAINAANANAGADSINFDTAGVFATAQTITLTSGELVVSGNLTILGTGSNLLTVSGNNASRVFRIDTGNTVTLDGLTIANGQVSGSFPTGFGGGIFNDQATLTVSNSTVRNNSGTGNGGGIFNNSGTLTVSYSTVRNNNSSGGGGIANRDTSAGAPTLTVNNSTISGNSSSGIGGGIFSGSNHVSSPATLNITNSTISGNSAVSAGGIGNLDSLHGTPTLNVSNSTVSGNIASNNCGGIRNAEAGGTATATLNSTIVSDNSAPSIPDIGNDNGSTLSGSYNLVETTSGYSFSSGSNNIFGIDPMLGPLADNGGPTQTHALLCGSPAIDKGINSNSLITDQRGAGFARTFDDLSIINATGGDGTDIGAFELQLVCNQVTAIGPARVWLGLKNSDDVGTNFDLLAEVFKNSELTPIASSGVIPNVPGGGSGFNNAVLRIISLTLTGSPSINAGDTLRFRLSVRIAAASRHRSGTARLWYNGAATDTGATRDAGSRFNATIGSNPPTDYFLRSGIGFPLSTTAGTSKQFIDVSVDRAVGGNPFKPFGTWSKTFP
jgi:CSLREA domain-containing protein